MFNDSSQTKKKSTYHMIQFIENSRKCKKSLHGDRKYISGCLGSTGKVRGQLSKGFEETLHHGS